MKCSYFDAGVCRSCAWMGMPYGGQLVRKQERVASALPDDVPWLEPVASAESGFRNKAKMVIGGTASAPTLGILSPDGLGVDLRECGLHDPRLHDALPVIADFIGRAAVPPYSIPERRGELKHVLATVAPSGELMIRFVVSTTESLARIRKHLPWLAEQLPVAVVSANLQPAHKAVLEGPDEVLLLGETLTMEVNARSLHLRPQSFFQTNTEVAARLYREAASLVAEIDPGSVWDLYCGVGGFGLHLATPGRAVVGVEASEQAIESARLSSADLGLTATWVAGDATDFALTAADGAAPDLVIVNPPRRGIGSALASWLETSAVQHVLYSSCNVDSLAADLALMQSYTVTTARLLDMFPQTEHHEVLVSLRRA